jgi:ATP-dependent exoDNAse (exonuclease V) beta subunit
VDQVFNSISFIDKLKHVAIKEGEGIVKIIEHAPKNNEVVKKHEGWKIPKKDDEYINTKFLNSQEISNFIINLLNQKGKNEKNSPKDIMVLFRKRCEKIMHLKDILKQSNIPVSDSCKINFSDDLIILDLLIIIKFFLLPEDNLNLVSLLKSVFFKLSFDRNNQNIWDRVQIFYPEMAKKLIKFKCDFEEESLYDFYNELLYSYKFIKNFYQEFGLNCHEIIDIFLEKVSEFEKLLLGNKQIFIEWIQDNSEIILDNSNLDGIKLMTVHSAKGLQSPIVILADAGDSENMPNESYFWYKNNLIIPNFNEYKSQKIHQIQNERKNELKKESLRLLYVAITRAESELYVFGESKNKKDSWFNIAKNALGDNFIKYSDIKIKEPKYIFDKLECEDNNIPNYFNENYVLDAVKQNEIASNKEQIFSDIAIIRGNFIHKILCDISKICKTDIEEYITSLAYDENFDLLPKNDVDEIILITEDILKKFPNIFARNVFSEVSVANLAKNSKSILKIDKLIIQDNQIEIIEIKTDKSKAISKNNTPSEYSNQLNIYKKCISKIYPDIKVICKILSFYQKEMITL